MLLREVLRSIVLYDIVTEDLRDNVLYYDTLLTRESLLFILCLEELVVTVRFGILFDCLATLYYYSAPRRYYPYKRRLGIA